jgi:hypothetical protein
MDQRHNMRAHRRALLGVLAAGTLTACAQRLEPNTVGHSERYDEKRKRLYRETEEVKTFYRVNSYPT